jgi:carbamoyltransferase
MSTSSDALRLRPEADEVNLGIRYSCRPWGALSMRVLGLCHDVLICSAAVVEDGQVLSAIAEERLDRVKQSRVFPALAISRCLDEAGLAMSDIDHVAVGWNPGHDLETLPAGYLTSRRHRGEHLLQVPARLASLAGGTAAARLVIEGAYGEAPPISFVNHYDAHVGAGYFMSTFDEAALLTMDGRGEVHTGQLGVARGHRVEVFEHVRYPHSIGLFYGAVTQFLGFKPDGDEWKVMALASYADADNEFYESLDDLVRVQGDGRFSLDLDFFEFYNLVDGRMFSDRFVERFGAPRRRDGDIEERHQKLAAAMQLIFEQSTAKVLTALHERTGLDAVALSGGCFMNSVFNGKVEELTPFRRSFVSSCPDDSGTSVGAALFLEAQLTGQKAATPPQHNFWGPAYSDAECLAAVEKYRLGGTEVVEDPASRAAQDLVDGKIVGWFQGAMEFGQRALGNRSILLDPRREDGKDVINAAVKYRESFRPFAPAVLAESVSDWFECAPGTRVPYMERVLPFRKEKQHQVPAVVHEDGSGRLQTVEKGPAPRYRALIEEFHRLTGVPIVLNTSFNLNGEPVVCSPEDAIRTFYTCAMDVLYLGNVRIAKG